MHPVAQRRLGARGTGPKEVGKTIGLQFTATHKRRDLGALRALSTTYPVLLRSQVRHAMWFSGLQWEKLEAGKLDSPHRKQAAEAITAALKVFHHRLHVAANRARMSNPSAPMPREERGSRVLSLHALVFTVLVKREKVSIATRRLQGRHPVVTLFCKKT